MIQRLLARKLLDSAKKFPVVAVTGPRQSGKTTLVKAAFPRKPYVSLEDLDVRAFARSDPRGFLNEYPDGAILDEVQNVPELFSYLQTLVDEKRKAGLFVLTGSHQFLLMEHLSQTLAGRVRLLHLLPFSWEELKPAGWLPKTTRKTIFLGAYPALYDRKIPPSEWYPDYLRTYVERDVRLVKNVGDLSLFQKFLKLCASRTAQLVNLSSIGEECGIRHNTAKAWMSILEASFIVHLLKPHHRNFNKRLVKSPKLYFYDTGLACSLLEIENEAQLRTHPLWGSLFETAIVSELLKHSWNRGLTSHYYFWRDKTGHEIDCVIDEGGSLTPLEIKSGETVTADFFKNLLYWQKISHERKQAYLIYGGLNPQHRKETTVLGWQNLGLLFKNR